tara:strand:- start:1571 stop:1975 length:405 start_codon:yes stop_codon:yes gene_type:complete
MGIILLIVGTFLIFLSDKISKGTMRWRDLILWMAVFLGGILLFILGMVIFFGPDTPVTDVLLQMLDNSGVIVFMLLGCVAIYVALNDSKKYEEKLGYLCMGGAIILISIWLFPISFILVLILLLIFRKKRTFKF